MSGFISVHRSLLEWEWYSERNTCSVFIHCLFKANWKEMKYRGKTVKRGQFLTSRDKLASELGLSVKNVRTALKNLKTTNELAIESTRQGTVITVINYDKYQLPANETANKKANEGPTDGQQGASSNKDNKDNKEINNTPKQKRSVSKTLLDRDLELSDHWKGLAIKYWSGKNRNDLDPSDQFFQFKKHHMANATKSADWQSSWETWYCNAVKFNKAPFQLIQGNQPQPSNSPRQSMPKAGTIE